MGVTDKQIVELLGRNRLVDELLRADLEVAIPARDRGIDLIVYADKGRGVKNFVAKPIQMIFVAADCIAVPRRDRLESRCRTQTAQDHDEERLGI